MSSVLLISIAVVEGVARPPYRLRPTVRRRRRSRGANAIATTRAVVVRAAWWSGAGRRTPARATAAAYPATVTTAAATVRSALDLSTRMRITTATWASAPREADRTAPCGRRSTGRKNAGREDTTPTSSAAAHPLVTARLPCQAGRTRTTRVRATAADTAAAAHANGGTAVPGSAGEMTTAGARSRTASAIPTTSPARRSVMSRIPPRVRGRWFDDDEPDAVPANPASRARTMASPRVAMPSFTRTEDTWFSTVFTAMPSSRAMTGLGRPRARSSTTSRSRGMSWGSEASAGGRAARPRTREAISGERMAAPEAMARIARSMSSPSAPLRR